MTEICGKGHDLLSFFNIDYHEFIKEITDKLMSHPDKNFRLSLERIPIKKTKAPKYIQPKSVSSKKMKMIV